MAWSEHIRAYPVAILPLALLILPVHAQVTVTLAPAEVIAPRWDLSAFGRRSEKIDSATMSQFVFRPVADALSFNSGVYVKSYGPGNLATTSIRGAGAEQTAVLWEGLNIQNAMLGQIDLSLLPTMLFDRVEVEYGGSSALWGSGAVGGNILLSGNRPWLRGINALAAVGTGNTGQTSGAVKVAAGSEKVNGAVKIFNHSSDNRYQYLEKNDGLNEVRAREKAAFGLTGALADLKFRTSKGHLISVHGWLTDNFRNIPSTIRRQEFSTQKDKSLRLLSAWGYGRGPWLTQVRGAFFSDEIIYENKFTREYTLSRVNTLIGESMSRFRRGNFSAHAGANWTMNEVESGSYSVPVTRHLIGVIAGTGYRTWRGRLRGLLNVRAGLDRSALQPVTGNVAVEAEPVQDFVFQLNFARVYRLPTLNELYWNPGGNPELKPESGNAVEGTVRYARQVGKFRGELQAAAYTRSINNWILWVPGASGNASPLNVQRVWSRGTETSVRGIWRSGAWNVSLHVATGYVLATVAQSELSNSSTTGKQIVYTPRYTGNAGLSAGWRGSVLTAFVQYTGYRFTASDHSQWLPPYRQSFVRFTQKVILKKTAVVLFAACNNVLNEAYEILPGRPMPLRNYEVGIQIEFTRLKTK